MSDLEPLFNAPEPHLRSILRALCADKNVSNRAVSLMSALVKAEASRKDESAKVVKEAATPQDQEVVSTTTGTKRKAGGTLQICITCKDAFVEEENTNTSCRCHTGERLCAAISFPQADYLMNQRSWKSTKTQMFGASR